MEVGSPEETWGSRGFSPQGRSAPTLPEPTPGCPDTPACLARGSRLHPPAGACLCGGMPPGRPGSLLPITPLPPGPVRPRLFRA